jgi:membrane protease subunit HflC
MSDSTLTGSSEGAERPPGPRRGALGLLLAAALGLPFASLSTVDATEVAVITAFGRPVRTVDTPGLLLRAPWPLHEVIRYDRRAQLLPVPPTEMLTRDKKNLVVEPYVVWRVADPARFLETTGTAERAQGWLSDLVVSRVAAALGQREFQELVGVDLGASPLLPEGLGREVDEAARARLGVEVLEVRLRHVGLPAQNEQSIYARMRAERSRIANQYRSEGKERAAAIHADADRQAAELLARADEDAGAVRATAEAEAEALYRAAFARDPQLFLLLRRLEAAERILDEDTVVVVHSEDLVGELLGGLP